MKQEVKDFVDKLSRKDATDLVLYMRQQRIGKPLTVDDIDIYEENPEGFRSEIFDLDVAIGELWSSVDVFNAVPAHVVQVLGTPSFIVERNHEGYCGVYMFVEQSTDIPIILVDNQWFADGYYGFEPNEPEELWASTEPMALEIYSDEGGGAECAARFRAALDKLIKKHKERPLWANI